MSAKPYNGHHCWNCWNVALWIGNDEGLYRLALKCKEGTGSLTRAAQEFREQIWLGGSDKLRSKNGIQTPDGARFTMTSVKAALAGLE